MMYRLLILSIFFSFSSFSQYSEKLIGSQSIQNYTAKDYKGAPQVNCVASDSRGVLYFGHNEGLSIWNGTKWKLINTNDKGVMSIYIDEIDNIYIGTEEGVGYLDLSKNGLFTFKLYESTVNNFGLISSIIEFNNVVYLCDSKSIYKVKDNLIEKVLSSEKHLIKLFEINNALYIDVSGKGLQKIKTSDFTLNSDSYSDQTKVNAILPYSSNSSLIVNYDSIYLCHFGSNKVEFFNLPSDGSFRYRDICIYEKEIFIATKSKGVLRFNSKNELIEIIDVNNGLINNSIEDLLITNDNNLVIVTKNGISIVDINNNIRKIGVEDGVHGALESIFINNTIKYAVGLEGVFKYENSNSLKFEEINNLKQESYGGGVVNDEAYFILLNGIYKLINDSLHFETDDYAWSIKQYNKNYYIVGAEQYFIIYKKDDNNKWLVYEKIEIPGLVKNVEIDLSGTIWLSAERANGGVYSYAPAFNNSVKEKAGKLTFFDGKQIGTTGDISIFEYKNKVYFTSPLGILEYNQLNQQFVKTKDFGESVFEMNVGVQIAKVDHRDNLWLLKIIVDKKRELGYIDTKGNWNGIGFASVNDNSIYSITSESKNTVWFAGPEGLFTYNYSKKISNQTYPITLSKLALGDSIIHFGNFKKESGFTLSQPKDFEFVFPYSKKPLKFEFSSINYSESKETKYSFFLKGFDEGWSEWTKNNEINYTNIPEGKYKMHAKSMNSNGIQSNETIITFTILPPWYHTWWARILYVLGGLLIIFTFIRSRTAKLKKRQAELEHEVELATEEIKEQKIEVEQQRDKANLQKELVEEKNKEILDSITYAKRIQNAILPPPRLVKEWLNDSFIFYKPKDIVAGDFYWMEVVKREGRNIIFYAAADCTGHGVPGAMVSVVCSNALNRSVKEFNITDPAKLLDKVTELVKVSFEQSDEAIKDGMDIAICALDLVDKKVWFAGAHNPLYRITELDTKVDDTLRTLEVGNRKLVEYKADKQPVGEFEFLKPFTTTEIQLVPGDCIYIFSDGFADQFGGEKGKKYKSANFKKFLMQIESKEMAIQKEILDTEINRWRGEIEQLDDICVIGLRVNGHMSKIFTKRELEILKHIIDGKPSKQIAEDLFISKHTVDTHRKRILAKSNTKSALSLAKFCEQHGVF